MRRIVTWALSTLTVLVLLFSYHTSTSSGGVLAGQVAASGPSAGSAPTAPGSSSSGPSSGPSSGRSSGSTSGSSSGRAATGSSTVAGAAVDTRFGPVQVQITVTGGKVTAASVLQVPNQERRDQMINSMAVPILNSEAVAAQSARIDAVSGATVTSGGYIKSLQSAIDKAHL